MTGRSDEDYMRLAIELSRDGVKSGQTPFGACIVKDGQIISLRHNEVWKNTDITAHAEVVAIRDACERLGSVTLSGCTIYSSCEPCPMCFSAIHWAKMARIVYGARISDALRYGFNELPIYNQTMARMGDSDIEVQGDVLRQEALVAFDEFLQFREERAY